MSSDATTALPSMTGLPDEVNFRSEETQTGLSTAAEGPQTDRRKSWHGHPLQSSQETEIAPSSLEVPNKSTCRNNDISTELPTDAGEPTISRREEEASASGLSADALESQYCGKTEFTHRDWGPHHQEDSKVATGSTHMDTAINADPCKDDTADNNTAVPETKAIRPGEKTVRDPAREAPPYTYYSGASVAATVEQSLKRSDLRCLRHRTYVNGESVYIRFGGDDEGKETEKSGKSKGSRIGSRFKSLFGLDKSCDEE